MTRGHYQQTHCPNCGQWHSTETAFGRWIRNHPELDSQKGYCVVDQDYWHLKWKTAFGRQFELLMGIEIKTLGAELTEAQRNLLHIVNQLLRNRRETPTKPLKYQAGNAPLQVVSTITKQKINVRCYGIHVLQFSRFGPDDSEWIKWDGISITKDILVSLLKFDLDPDTLNALDLKRHHVLPVEYPKLNGI